MEREKKSKVGLENLSKAIKQTPSFGSEDSQQSVIEKLYHVRKIDFFIISVLTVAIYRKFT